MLEIGIKSHFQSLRKEKMKLYPKITATLIGVFLFYSPVMTASAAEMTSVIDYPKQNDMSDKFHQSSLMARCAGVLGAFSKFLPKSPASMKAAKENLFQQSMQMLTVSAILLGEKKQVPAEKALEQVQTAFQAYVDYNYKKIEQEQIATGSIMQGTKATEMQFCINFGK